MIIGVDPAPGDIGCAHVCRDSVLQAVSLMNEGGALECDGGMTRGEVIVVLSVRPGLINGLVERVSHRQVAEKRLVKLRPSIGVVQIDRCAESNGRNECAN